MAKKEATYGSVGVTGRNGSHPIRDNGDVNDKYGPHPVSGHVGMNYMIGSHPEGVWVIG